MFNTILTTDISTNRIADPSTLVLGRATLYLFAFTGRYRAFEDHSALKFLNARDFENLSPVQPAVTCSAHSQDTTDLYFVDTDASIDHESWFIVIITNEVCFVAFLEACECRL